MQRLLRWLGIVVGAAIAVTTAVILIAGLLHEAKPVERTAGGAPRLISLYVPMSDGVRIAIDVALPDTLKAGERAPVLIKGTPYWRGVDLSFLGKAAAQLHLFDSSEPDVPLVNARGYIVITADTRGTGASFGHLSIPFGDREIEDFGELIDWAVKQPWSDGRVGAYGFSYRGMLAVNMASLGRPALKAIAPSFDFPDVYLSAWPGGVFNDRFIRAWSEQTAAANHGVLPCGLPCKLLVPAACNG
jgi:putative CocE/NonD family hydrolase